ncbi:MAG TPA: hypothetical protein VLE49_12625 [Anaerolineales bacterium]|nr:hypothetical protein [Anaerolineales bacterium]
MRFRYAAFSGWLPNGGRLRSSAAKPSSVGRASQRFRQVWEVPRDAQNIHFYKNARKLPARYQSALQNIR